MITVFRREMHGYFCTPVGYVFLAMYTLLAGVVFVFVNIGQEMSASANLLLSGMQLPFLLIAPLLTMRLFAEERRARTDQLVLTSPVKTAAVVGGKMLAAGAMLLLAMGLTALYFLLISRYAQVSGGEIFSVYLGYFLLGLCFLSVGLWLSSLCQNPMTAGILTLGVNLLLYLSEHYIAPQMNAGYLSPVRFMLSFLPSSARLGDFANAVVSLSDTVYFLAFTGLMLFFTVRTIEARRHGRGRGA